MSSAVASPRGSALVCTTSSQSTGASFGVGEIQAERARELCTRRIDVDQRHLRAPLPRAQESDQCTDHTCADHRDRPGRKWVCIPGCVQRSLHVRGQHRARNRNVRWHRQSGVDRHVEHGLVGMEGEHITSDQAVRPGLHATDRRVTILHREREASAHVGRPHPLVFARWHLSRSNQRLGAAADAAIAGAHPDHAFSERTQFFPAGFQPVRGRHTKALLPSTHRATRTLLRPTEWPRRAPIVLPPRPHALRACAALPSWTRRLDPSLAARVDLVMAAGQYESSDRLTAFYS